jgi:gliding motility-associated-like protein
MLTVRDNAVAGGQVASATRTLTVDGASGPFDVVSQSTSQLLIAGQRLRVLWEVANTDQPPVNTAEVDLLLSMDGGFTFPVILASQVPNDGAHEIIVPKQITSEGRIKVAAVGNVFYSINAANLTIKEEIEIPKGFTPNGDGQNDAWALKNTDIGTEETAFFPRASVRIHNRAGQVVYAASWYRNDWQGETLQGVKIPIGTYVFEVFSESGEFATKRGWLYVKY